MTNQAKILAGVIRSLRETTYVQSPNRKASELQTGVLSATITIAHNFSIKAVPSQEHREFMLLCGIPTGA